MADDQPTANDDQASHGNEATRPTPILPDLPFWVWDVLADVVDYEEQHSREWACLETTLRRLPDGVWHGAVVVAWYRRKALAGDAP